MKRIKVLLHGRGWDVSASGRVHFKGAAFIGGRLVRSADEIAALLPTAGDDVNDWTDVLANWNGFFALVVQQPGRVLAAVDFIRSMPLFYGENDELACVGDDAESARRLLGEVAMDPVARDEFRLTGFVTGGRTLYPSLMQIQAGEFITIGSSSTNCASSAYRYFRFLHFEPASYQEDGLRMGLTKSVDQAMDRLIEYAGGRQVVVPLSGGYDSRLVASSLARRRYPHVLTFSYGGPGNKEAAYSSRVANALGLPWHFVEYRKEQWLEAGEQRRAYQKWASGWSSLPHIQDWLAVRGLRSQGMVAEDSVFVPGHTCFRRSTGVRNGEAGDSKLDSSILIEQLLARHYWRSVGKSGPDRKSSVWKRRIAECGEISEVSSAAEYASAFERWEWQERQAKFICNSVRVYEFFGYNWWMPLWDTELVRFNQGVPLALRVGRKWYVDFIKDMYAAQAGQDALHSMGNAEDPELWQGAVRLVARWMPDAARDGLKLLREMMGSRRLADSCIVSHMSRLEIEQLQREGYRLDGILVHDFLRLES